MDLFAAKGQPGFKWAWARIGALLLFLLTGVQGAIRGPRSPAQPPPWPENLRAMVEAARENGAL